MDASAAAASTALNQGNRQMTALQFLLDADMGTTKDVTSSLKSVIFFLVMIILGIVAFIWWLRR
jgi:hypothetical protein